MTSRYGRILIAIDASDDADQVLETATNLDLKGGDRFQVVTVIPPVMDGVSGMGSTAFAATWSLQDIESAMRREITESVRERVARFGIPPERVAVRYGRPAAEIRAEAHRLGADLIVIGTHGRHGLPRVMLGSTAAGVLHGATCDVLTVRIDN